jgi:hypothetical protein
MNKGQEFFIRELTRKLNEQINSVRRELDNLKKLGLLRTRTKNRKKYYYVNKDFIILEELRSIISKALSSEKAISKEIEKMGDVKLLVLSGQFTGKEDENIDMLLVGIVDRERFSRYLADEIKTEKPVRFTIMNEDDYRYRIGLKDKFILDLTQNPENQILIDKFS